VDYELRRTLLASLDEESGTDDAPLVERLIRQPEDGRIKLYITTRSLRFRKAHRELFEEGEYLPLRAMGGRENHVIAFARRRGQDEALVVASRFFTRHGITRSVSGWVGPDTWRDTALLLPEHSSGARYRDVFTGTEFTAQATRDGGSLSIAGVLQRLPVALLERVGDPEGEE
jgi:(1->4)-alpha-D-glucan 1-alpha-D-glucosylmutase